jgi:hypothetical protein
MKIKVLKIDNWMLVIFIIIAITFGFALGMFLTNSHDKSAYCNPDGTANYINIIHDINRSYYAGTVNGCMDGCDGYRRIAFEKYNLSSVAGIDNDCIYLCQG